MYEIIKSEKVNISTMETIILCKTVQKSTIFF